MRGGVGGFEGVRCCKVFHGVEATKGRGPAMQRQWEQREGRGRERQADTHTNAGGYAVPLSTPTPTALQRRQQPMRTKAEAQQRRGGRKGEEKQKKKGVFAPFVPLFGIREPRYLSVFATGKAARTTRARKTTTKMFCKN